MFVKCADTLWSDIKYLLEGIRQNGINSSEALKSSAIGAISAALAGAGIGALSAKKGQRRRKALKGAMIGGLAGAIGGPLAYQLKKYIEGVPYDNRKFFRAEHKPGEKVYIGVSGASNGENRSWFAYDLRKAFPGKVVMLRFGDDINHAYKTLKGMGLDVTLVGHSYGAAAVSRFLRNHPDAKGYSIDPVGWMDRGVSSNNVVFTPDEKTRHGTYAANTMADIGGRWNYEGRNSIVFKGSHNNRNGDLINDFVARGVTPENIPDKMPGYVTKAF